MAHWSELLEARVGSIENLNGPAKVAVEILPATLAVGQFCLNSEPRSDRVVLRQLLRALDMQRRGNSESPRFLRRLFGLSQPTSTVT